MDTLGLERLGIDVIESDRLRRLYELWNTLRGERALPDRADFLPEQASFLLGQLTLVDVLREPLNFHLRLIGTRVEDRGRRGDQGKTVDQLEPESLVDTMRQVYSEVVDSKNPAIHRVTYHNRETVVSFERIILPFSRGGQAVRQLLEGVDWSPGTKQNFRHMARPVPELESA